MNNKKQTNILNYFDAEPFSRREAWFWLLDKAHNRTNPGKVTASANTLAREWKWHKSKVERFIRFLRNKALIETLIYEHEACLTICIIENYLDFQKDSDANSDVISETELNFTSAHLPKRDNYREYMKQLEIRQIPNLYKTLFPSTKTLSRQNLDTYFPKKKKEKYQKKEKEEDLKEKNIPYRDIKKEKIWDDFHDQLNALQITDMIEFAASIGIDSIRLELELEEFKKHANRYNTPPKSVIAAFRNWLRRSVEFEYARLENTKRLLALKPSSFKELLTGSAKAIAERQKEREANENEKLKLVNADENG